ncbi:hypothetical protein AMTR_s00012p00259580 [Amborella trichopoda]|uniref:Uncharacterized protein n=1 Tax=Amborella trichopoda TaxID=13333 RepID=W1PJW1_AMBTC|nr:hypothetical protein AMTR_s00012p00259580 [Amborella trichopoda]
MITTCPCKLARNTCGAGWEAAPRDATGRLGSWAPRVTDDWPFDTYDVVRADADMTTHGLELPTSIGAGLLKRLGHRYHFEFSGLAKAGNRLGRDVPAPRDVEPALRTVARRLRCRP